MAFWGQESSWLPSKCLAKIRRESVSYALSLFTNWFVTKEQTILGSSIPWHKLRIVLKTSIMKLETVGLTNCASSKMPILLYFLMLAPFNIQPVVVVKGLKRQQGAALTNFVGCFLLALSYFFYLSFCLRWMTLRVPALGLWPEQHILFHSNPLTHFLKSSLLFGVEKFFCHFSISTFVSNHKSNFGKCNLSRRKITD